MKDRKTFLFFPLEIGLAHIVRSLAIAEELHHRGHKVVFALPKRKHEIVKNTPLTLVDVHSPLAADTIERLSLLRDKKVLRQQVKEELELIHKYKPDAIVIDYRISALAAAAIADVKTYFIAHGSGLPYGSYIPNPGLSSFIYRALIPVIHKGMDIAVRVFLQPLLEITAENGKPKNLDEWFKETTWILPEPSFYLPAKSKDLRLHYVGALEWQGFKHEKPSWLSDIHPDGKTLYLTFGGTGFAPNNLIQLSTTLVDAGYRVVVSTGTICNPDDFPTYANLFVSRFLPGKDVCGRVDAVICHGGFGTLIETVTSNKPFITIPFNPDQLIHAWRMQELGLGYCLLTLNPADLLDFFRFRWKVFEEAGKKVSPQQVLEALQKIETNQNKFKESLDWFNKNHQYRNGAKEAADIISV